MPAPRILGPLTVLFALALLGGGWAALRHYRTPVRERSAHETWARVRQAYEREEPGRDRAATLRELASVGELAAPYLAAALLSTRPALAHDAEQALADQLAAWRQLPAEQAAAQVSALAQALAAALESNPPPLSEETRFAVRRLTQRLADWPLRPSSPHAAPWLAACERLASRLPAPQVEVARAPASSGGRSLAGSNAAAPQELLTPSLRSPPPVTAPPTPALAGPEPDLAPAELPQPPLPATPTGPEPRALTPRGFIPPVAQPLLPEPVLESRPENQPPAGGDASSPGADEPGGVQPAALSQDWFRSRADVEVMRLLQHAETDVRLNAAAELRRRGFQAAHLKLAQRLTHSSAAERRAFAEELPQLAGINPLPWLRQLSADPDPSVRAVAASILAATPDSSQRR